MANTGTVVATKQNDRLVAIPRLNWPRLLAMYRCDWPAHMLGCYTLETFGRWTADAEMRGQTIRNLAVYSLNGDWSEDGTYVCVHRYQVFAHTLSDATGADRLRRALQLLPEWRHGYWISALYDRLRPVVLSISHELRIDCIQTRLYYMPRDQAAKLDVKPPPGIELRPLQSEHADFVNDLWPNRHDGSAYLIRQMIKRSPSVGAFVADDGSPNSGQLVAWCLQLQSGLHGVLQVHPEHQRRGLGGLVCLAMAKLQADLGWDSSGSVFLNNYASMGLFEKAGFVVLDRVSWMQCVATKPRVWLD